MSFYNDNGFVKITWTNATKDDTWYAWRVYRRELGGDALLIGEDLIDQPEYEFHDWTARSTYEYEWAVVQVSNEFGSLIESGYAWEAPDTQPVSEDYWLIDPNNEDNTFRLYSVIEDSFGDEYEAEPINLIGYGRHMDFGEHWGVAGSMTIQFRDNAALTARQQYNQVSDMRTREESVYVRTPFGDLWLAAIGNTSFSRMAGVGQRAFGDLTIPYTEVGELETTVSSSSQYGGY